jgi:hypothetical protein
MNSRYISSLIRGRGSSVGIATAYGRRSIPGRGKRYVSTPQLPALKPTQLPIKWVLGALSPGVNQPGREADHAPLTIAEVKNGGAIPPLQHGIVLNLLSSGTILPF